MAYKTEETYYSDDYIDKISIQIFGTREKLINCLEFNFGHYPKYKLSVDVNEEKNIMTTSIIIQ